MNTHKVGYFNLLRLFKGKNTYMTKTKRKTLCIFVALPKEWTETEKKAGSKGERNMQTRNRN